MLVLILILGRSLQAYADSLIFYAGTALFTIVCVRYLDWSSSDTIRVIRLGYPILLFTLFYRATGGTMFLVFDRFFDSNLVGFETSVFGIEPTLYIDRHLLNVWCNEILSLCYFAYYPLIPVYFGWLLFRGRERIYISALTAVTTTFFVCYLLFFLYPIEGPRWHQAGQYTHQIVSPVSRHLADFVIRHAAVRGGCMPSSHFAVTLVIWMYSFRYYRRTGWLLLPFVIGLGIGTVWGRYHYVSDVIVGAAIGLTVTLITWIRDRAATSQELEETPKALAGTHAS